MRRRAAKDGMRGDAAVLLSWARDSLADSRRLRGRRNATVLLDLSMWQALSSISLRMGLEAPEGTPLDALLRRVPSDHPASALAGRLADPRARDADAVGRLIDALSDLAPGRDDRDRPTAVRTAPAPRGLAQHGTDPTPGMDADRDRRGSTRPAHTPTTTPGTTWAGRGTKLSTPAAPTTRMRSATGRAGSDRHGDAGDDPGENPGKDPGGDPRDGSDGRRAALDDGPTAFEAAAGRAPDPRRTADAAEPRAATSTAFWALADRWGLADRDALALLGSGRGPTAKGTRLRFGLRGEEAARFGRLRRIETGLDALGETPDWLRRARPEAPFHGQTPLALLLDSADAAEQVVHTLNRSGLRAALGDVSRGRDGEGE